MKGNNQADRKKRHIAKLAGLPVPEKQPAIGGIASLELKNVEKIPPYEEMNWIPELQGLAETHFVDIQAGRMVVATADSIIIKSLSSDQKIAIHSPFFKNLHGVVVQFGSDPLIPTGLTVCSSGLDSIFEFSYNGNELTLQSYWSALTLEENSMWLIDVTNQQLIHSATNDIVPFQSLSPLGLDTRERKVSVNSLFRYENCYLVTCLLSGNVLSINFESNRIARTLLWGLHNPHDIFITGESMWVTSTSEGSFLRVNTETKKTQSFDFTHMPGKSSEDEDAGREWIQSTVQLGESLFASVDVNRHTVWVFDISKKTIRKLEYDERPAIQKVKSCSHTH